MIVGSGENDEKIRSFPLADRAFCKLASYSIVALDSPPPDHVVPVAFENCVETPKLLDTVCVVQPAQQDSPLISMRAVVRATPDGAIVFSGDPTVASCAQLGYVYVKLFPFFQDSKNTFIEYASAGVPYFLNHPLKTCLQITYNHDRTCC
jgi:hypothetical protein